MIFDKVELNNLGIVIIIFVIGILLLFIGIDRLKRKKLIEGLVTSKIRSLAMGLVEIFGKIEGIKKITSPFSKTDCVYCKYFIEEFRNHGKSSSWVTINKGILKENFYLKDSTGKVLVDPTNAEVDVPIHYREESNGRLLSINIKKFLDLKNINATGLLGFGKKLRFTEYILKPNQELFIIGTAGDNPFVKEGTGTKNEQDIMIQKDKNWFLISNKDEKSLLKSYNWIISVTLILGFILTIMGFALGLKMIL